MSTFGGEGYAEIKKATEIGIYIGGFFNDVGSPVITIGGVYPIMVEHPLTIIRLYRAKWLRDKFNIEQKTLARLHYQEGFTVKQLAERFKVSLSTIKATLYGLRAKKKE